MLIALIGESCVGKSTLAKKLKSDINSTIYTGKDYLKLAKNEDEAIKIFAKLLENSANSKIDNIIYIITEKAHLSFLPKNTFKIVMLENLEIIKQRFKNRMNNILPLPIEKMIEQKHGMFNDEPSNLTLASSIYEYKELLDAILNHQTIL